jgi:hypothetical protein
MISVTWLAVLGGASWSLFLFYMAFGRDWVHEPLWVWIGVPATVVALVAIGHFYYGLPVFYFEGENQ